jgi:hypothetical protein
MDFFRAGVLTLDGFIGFMIRAMPRFNLSSG